MVRRALVGVGDPLALAVSHRWPIVTLDVRRGMMPAVGDVLLVVDAAIRRFREKSRLYLRRTALVMRVRDAGCVSYANKPRGVSVKNLRFSVFQSLVAEKPPSALPEIRKSLRSCSFTLERRRVLENASPSSAY